MKQTAVEFIEKGIQESGLLPYKWLLDLINQAKEMEKEHRKEVYLKGFKDGKEYQIKLDELTFKSE